MILAGLALLAVLFARRKGPAAKDRLFIPAALLSLAVVVCGGFVLYLGVQSEGGLQPHAVAGDDDLLDMDLNQSAGDFEFISVYGDSTGTLSDYHGKVVVLNVWATWCAPCLTEIPELNRLHKRYQDRGVVVLSLSDESPEELRDFNNRLRLETVSATVEDMSDLPRPIQKAFEIRPTTYIIDRDGNLRRYVLGARSYGYFEQAILPHL